MTTPQTRRDLRQQPAESAAPSPAARAHQLQLARLTKLRAQLAELDALAQSHREQRMGLIEPLRARHVQARKQLVRALDAAVQDAREHKWLSATQRSAAQQRLVAIAQGLAEDGHADMVALHDAHSPQTLAQKREARAAALRAQFEAALGAPLDDLDGASPEAVLRAGWQRLTEATQEQRDERREKRRRKREARRPEPEAHASAPVPVEAQADAVLRGLYRQLASALHPDRETDAGQRDRKTALMSEANAAYGRRDLLALMDLQQRAALAETGTVPEARLAALTLLLKGQVATLERERASRQQALAQLAGLPEGVAANANTLRQARIDAVQRLETELAWLDDALAQTADAAGLKRWLSRSPPPAFA